MLFISSLVSSVEELELDKGTQGVECGAASLACYAKQPPSLTSTFGQNFTDWQKFLEL